MNDHMAERQGRRGRSLMKAGLTAFIKNAGFIPFLLAKRREGMNPA